MLTARRFTTVPTKDTRNRLNEALSNSRPIARAEPHRGAVVVIQSALADLNRGYLLPAEIDGFFGARTYAAVEAFQRDYGLVADGLVGKQTLTQLNHLYSGDVIRQPVGRSIHVGVDKLDAAHYGGTFDLASCVNDARKTREIAQSLGYDTTILENENATVANFTGFMRGAMTDLCSGDSLLISFSGHGSQIPNTSDDEEADALDETLCFYDRMLLDDEFYALLAQFRDGVRVHAVFDSCHSATVAKALSAGAMNPQVERDLYLNKNIGTLKTLSTVTVVAIGEPPEEGAEPPKETGQPIAAGYLSKALDGENPKLAEAPKPKKDLSNDIAELFADLHTDSVTGKGKSIQLFRPIYDKNKNLYDAIKNVVGPQENQQLSCSVITLSACQDSQTTPAGQVYSLFTYNIISAWNSGSFEGSYRQFHSSLKTAGPADSVPAINKYGTGRAESRLYDRPFVF